ncbi:MAG: hypothetical protein GY929_08970 [Actinomycetia bacterium]|nr:hypothetical protein [Actinomycetes bacterium]
MIVPKGFGAGEHFRLQTFQRSQLADLWGTEATRVLVSSIARGNAKTTLPAAVGVAVIHLVPNRPHVPVVSVSRDKAGELVDLAVEIIDQSPELKRRSHWYASAREIRVPATGGRMFALAANRDTTQGFDPTVCLIDELGFIDPDVFTAMIGSLAKRPHPGGKLWAFGTPGWDKTGVMWNKRKEWFEGSLSETPGFLWREWAADPKLPITSREAWLQANPMLQAGLMDEATLAMLAAGAMTEPEFRAFRLGQWTARVDQAIDPGDWSALAHELDLADGTPVVLGFVGGQGDHATALVAVEIDRPHLHVLGLWERPEGDRAWRAPRREITETLYDAMGRFDVHAARVHPAGWRSELEAWQARWGDRVVLEWSVSRRATMAPASDRLLAAVSAGDGFRHDGHPILARHAAAAVTEQTADGAMVRQDERSRVQQGRIEGLAAAVAAHDAAVEIAHLSSGRLIH